MQLPHPFPYQGSKRQLALAILRYFPTDVDRLVEPFCGSAAVSIAAAFYGKAQTFVLNDLNTALMQLWDHVLHHPHQLSDNYQKLWEAQLGRERTFYDWVRDEFNHKQCPEYFLYLLARCVKGSVRYNSDGEFNQSPDNRRKGMRPSTMRQNIVGTAELLRGKTQLSSEDFQSVLDMINENDVVYFDPPYQGVSGRRDPRYLSGIDTEEFIDVLAQLNRRQIPYLLSYDGRTGTKRYGSELPQSLGLVRIELAAGRSSQATLLGRKQDTVESLYLSPALYRRTQIYNKSSVVNWQLFIQKTWRPDHHLHVS